MIPSFERTSSLVARGLGVTPADLLGNFRDATAADVPAIIALRESVSGRQLRWDDAQFLGWRYGLGATRRAYARYRILVHKGEVIAGIGAEEFTLRTPAGNVAAACPMDILSLPNYRNLGLGPWLNQALFQQYPLVVALGANSNSLGLVSRLYSPLPGRRTFQLPLNLAQFLQKRIANRLLYNIVSPLATVAVRLRGHWITRRFPKHRWQIKQRSRFETIWDGALSQGTDPDGISIARSADYLNWRYCENPRMNYRVLAMQRGPDLIGYMIYRQSSEPNEERHVHIADWWWGPAADEHTMSSLTGAVLADVHSFWPSFVAASALGEPHHEQLRKAGFIARAGEHNATGYHCEKPELLPAVQAVERWRLTDLGDDSDGVS